MDQLRLDIAAKSKLANRKSSISVIENYFEFLRI